MADYRAGNIFSVPDLVVVVTGGGSGIGLMMTKAFALNGAHQVFIIGRRKEVLEKAAKESPHNNIVPVVGDVTSKESLQAAVEKIKADVGYINVLVANSGIMGPIPEKKPAEVKSIEEYQSQWWNVSTGRSTHANCTFDQSIQREFHGHCMACSLSGDLPQKR